MNLLHTRHVTVAFAGDFPAQLDCDGTSYRVTDAPTPLEELFYGMTHIPDLTGWRFQGTDENGVSHVFDIILRGETWQLARLRLKGR